MDIVVERFLTGLDPKVNVAPFGRCSADAVVVELGRLWQDESMLRLCRTDYSSLSLNKASIKRRHMQVPLSPRDASVI